LIALAFVLICHSHVSAAERPNVLVILTDDQGWGDLSLNGNTNLSTPNVDSLARDGTSVDRL
jgi:arylsulfatase A-like enzyme